MCILQIIIYVQKIAIFFYVVRRFSFTLFIQKLSSQITSVHCVVHIFIYLFCSFFLFQIKIELLNTFITTNYPYFGFAMSRGHHQVN